MNRKAYRFLVMIAIVICGSTECLGQIPAQGEDFTGLGFLHWGMPMQEVKDSLLHRRTFKVAKDTTLVYEDDLLGTKTNVTMTFTKAKKMLAAVTINAKGADNEAFAQVSKRMVEIYGEPTKVEKKQERKLFMTIDLITSMWWHAQDAIFLIEMSRSGKPLGYVLSYASLERRKWE